MNKQEKEQVLREAVLSLDPKKICEAGERTGHEVKLQSDMEIVMAAAEMILFYIPDAPQNVKNKAINTITFGSVNMNGFFF